MDIKKIKKAIRGFLPKSLVNIYHGLWLWLSAAFYGFPSKNLIIIGVTGTNGKSTTVNLIAKALEASGEKVAFTSTVNFKIDQKEWLNTIKMTMPGRNYLQKFLKDAKSAGCKYVVIETSSEGLVQNRHWGMYYDVAVFTNLTPEHIESHGGFEEYKKAKKILFETLKRSWRKKIDGQVVPTIIVANADDQYADYYLESKADRKITFGFKDSSFEYTHLKATDIKVDKDKGIEFRLVNDIVQLNLKGRFDVYNTLAALAVAQMLDVPFQKTQEKLGELKGVPGRLEIVIDKPYMVLVDYAPEPESLRQLYQTISMWGRDDKKIIHVLGSTGGGRDISRRPIMGDIAAKNADIVIVTNEDPYDDDPSSIINEVAAGAIDAGKTIDEDLFKILDRKEAIKKSLLKANEGDLVLITGKGAEQKMAVSNGFIDWDDREVVREEYEKINQNN